MICWIDYSCCLNGQVVMTDIRLMKSDDYDEVYDLWLNTSGMGLNTVDDSKEGIARFLLRNPTSCFVAQVGGKIVGAIICGHDGRRGYIYHTAVSEKFRHQGIAGELLKNAMEALDREGIQKAALVVFEKNHNGNAFWEKHGFTVREDLIYRNKNIHEFERINT